MSWWAWILVGIGLLVVEMVAPGGLFALFFGIGALATGALVGAGLGGPTWLQWIFFAGLSLLLLGVLRRRWRGKLAAGQPVDGIAGEAAVVVAEVPADGVGQAELRGTPWEARSASGEPIGRGTRCRVEKVVGLTLYLRPE